MNWIKKYGIDFIKNYGELNIETLARFLNVKLEIFMYDSQYKDLRDKFKKI